MNASMLVCRPLGGTKAYGVGGGLQIDGVVRIVLHLEPAHGMALQAGAGMIARPTPIAELLRDKSGAGPRTRLQWWEARHLCKV